ncbi:alpha/beta fold hydrolase [Nocardioides sp. GXZ039]|uniref:alpha/beta fold hydrolase n=1 Tax=Nocardioides sp. GXZ039 TaxID=3136018 RepID=UPI0030F39F24
MRKGYVDGSTGQVHYRWVGEDGPVVVLLHQTASSSRMYERFMAAMPSGYRLIALDTPGFGASDPYAAQPSTAQLVAALAEAVAALGHDRYHLLGHHTGAALACEWAAGHGEAVRSLAMIGGLAMGAEARANWLAGVSDAPLSADGAHLLRAWERVAGIDAVPVASPPDVDLRHREAVDVLIASPRWPEAYRAVFSQDFEAHLERVGCPALLMSGTEDILWPYFEATAASKPDMRTDVLPGGAYALDQHTEAVVTIYLDFLTGLRTA